MTSIGSNAFNGCTGLTSISIPSSVTSIGDYAFYRCTGLTSITIPSSVTSIGNSAFSSCTGLTSISILSGVTTIERRVFAACTGLTSITIPSSVTSIRSRAFMDCSRLTSVTIPSSVTSIEDGAFYSCTGLTSVTVDNPMPVTITENTFPNRTNATLYVPAGSRAAYEAANYWKEFDTIEEMPSGQCGTNLYWAFYPATGHLTITGSGAMYVNESIIFNPWYDYFSSITITNNNLTIIKNWNILWLI